MTDAEEAELAEGVAALLSWIEERYGSYPDEARGEMSLNVLLNALTTVLEEVRRRDPERHRLYLRTSLVVLDED